MTMGYPTKIQLIQRPKNQQWHVNFPNALAEALQLQKGETVEWEIHSRDVIVMIRKEAPPAIDVESTVKQAKGSSKGGKPQAE
jgi:antitoxin component of MazEF toxin-antitoxin module